MVTLVMAELGRDGSREQSAENAVGDFDHCEEFYRDDIWVCRGRGRSRSLTALAVLFPSVNRIEDQPGSKRMKSLEDF